LYRQTLGGGWKARNTIGSPVARWWILRGLCGASLVSLVGCAVGPDFVRPEPPSVERYTYGAQPEATVPADGQAQHFEQGAKLVGEWWRLFSSTKLDDVIKEAIASNPNLQAAQASLRQSQDNLRAGYGIFYPQLDANFDATRQKFSPVRFGSSSASSIFNLFTLSTTISYALDVFGGERRTVEGLQAQVDLQRYTVVGTYLTLTGNIVNTLIAQAAYREEIKATEQIISLIEEQIRINEVQVQTGIVSYSSVLSLQSQLASIEATLPPLKQKLSEAEHLLATLAGRTPAEWSPLPLALADLTLPGDLPISLPSELVRQRPDILAVEAQLRIASANIGVATAALFPSFTLNGSYGLNNLSLHELFKNNSSFWSVGANLSAPLFQGGTLWFQRQAAIEGYQQSLANYRQTVLSALAQVADTLRALDHDAETLQAQSQAVQAAAEALRLLQANYQAGIATYLQILVANDQYHQTKIAYLQALAQRFQDTVALFVVLGGGWWDGRDL
jgi:NodT family efflux transporter outer membrane factor (OMF) lipoprotein